MNDYWNDPPDNVPEPPDCPEPKCEGSGEYLRDQETESVFKCDTCGNLWAIPFPKDPGEWLGDTVDTLPVELPEPNQCPHGNKVGECDSCDHAGDIAYDTWRESR